MQQYADIYSLQNYSTCFGCHNTHHQVQFLILMMGAGTPKTCRVVLQ